MTGHVLIVEPDRRIGNVLELILGSEFTVKFVCSLAELDQIPYRCDLMLTELASDQFSNLDGWVKAIRARVLDAPIMIVTNKDPKTFITDDFDQQISDYITKPFNNNELLLKCRRLAGKKTLYHCDPIKMQAVRGGRYSDELTAKEFRLLSLLAKTVDHSISVESATQELWGERTSDQRVHTLLSRIRPKLVAVAMQVEMVKNGKISMFFN